MAKIQGYGDDGLLARRQAAEITPESDRKAVKKKKGDEYAKCVYCGYEDGRKAKQHAFSERELDDGKQAFACVPCRTMFEELPLGGSGRCRDWDLAQKRLGQLRAGESLVVMLGNMSFSGRDGSVSLEMGDAFTPTRIGTTKHDAGTREHSMDISSVTISVGGEEVRLFAEEFSVLPYLQLMAEVKAGDYEAAYATSRNSDPGYFRPSLSNRIAIQVAYVRESEVLPDLVKQWNKQNPDEQIEDLEDIRIEMI